jgi:hypothetical protein
MEWAAVIRNIVIGLLIAGERSALGIDAVPGGHLHRPVAGGAAEDHLAQ